MIANVDLLTPRECDRICDVLEAHQHLWQIRRTEAGDFYTAGVASYLDAKVVASAYYQAARSANMVLRRHFAWLYTRLEEALADVLEAEVSFASGMALPGFHIFLGKEGCAHHRGAVHCDRQHTFLHWGDMQADNGRQISFTVSVKLPHAGSGLLMWDEIYDESRDYDELVGELKARSPSFVPYRRGGMCVHDGRQFHAIPAFEEPQPTDARITLQGHGVESNGAYFLYW